MDGEEKNKNKNGEWKKQKGRGGELQSNILMEKRTKAGEKEKSDK